MNFKAPFCTSASSLRAAAIAFGLAVVLVGLGGAPLQPVQAASSGLAYDELTKLVMSSQAAPVPGTFDADFQAAVNAQQAAANTPKHGGLFGGIMNTLNQAKNAMSIFSTGTATKQYFLGGWERSDDLSTQTATITKPRQHQVIYLDLAKKTYRIVDTSVQPITMTPAPYERPPSGPQGSPPPSPVPGTVKLNISVSTSGLGSKTLSNVPTNGYKMDFKITSTQATGSCINGSFETALTEYVSAYPEPTLAPTSSGPVTYHRPAPNPETMALKPGCKPKFTTRTHNGATPPTGRLSMWTLATINMGAQTSQGSMGGGFQTLIERGNVRALGAADKSLFEIPAGFTQEQPSPPPH